MSPASVAVTASPTLSPSAEFSAMERLSVSDAKAGALLTCAGATPWALLPEPCPSV